MQDASLLPREQTHALSQHAHSQHSLHAQPSPSRPVLPHLPSAHAHSQQHLPALPSPHSHDDEDFADAEDLAGMDSGEEPAPAYDDIHQSSHTHLMGDAGADAGHCCRRELRPRRAGEWRGCGVVHAS